MRDVGAQLVMLMNDDESICFGWRVLLGSITDTELGAMREKRRYASPVLGLGTITAVSRLITAQRLFSGLGNRSICIR